VHRKEHRRGRLNTRLLIDSIVRQVTVLIAQLATSGGVRAPVAHLANQVFFELARELEAQGVSRKVSADMFGMALRGYQRKLQRLAEGQTDPGRTLWQAVLDFVIDGRLVQRSAIQRRFKRDDQQQISAVLHDLKESGLIFSSGHGEEAVYRASTDDELGLMSRLKGEQGIEELAWGIIYREGPIDVDRLSGRLGRSSADTLRWVDALVDTGRACRRADGLLYAEQFVLPLGSDAGWEAAVFDHVQAVVQTICQRLRLVGEPSDMTRNIGGSTYSYEVSANHPLHDEVVGLLEELRTRAGALRQRVDEYNRAHPGERPLRVVTYLGQCVLESDVGGSNTNET
jgi:hypothetical protein